MPIVPKYQPTTGASVTGLPAPRQGGQVINPSTAASFDMAVAPGRAMQGMAQSIGGASEQLLKLQEQRNIRNDNITALNLFTEYDEAVRQMNTEALSRQGSEVFGLYENHSKALEEITRKTLEKAGNDRVRMMFIEHAYHTQNASLNQIAAHQASQEKVARDTAIGNLIQTHVNMINDAPSEEQLGVSIQIISDTIDMHYPAEKATEIKSKVIHDLKKAYVLSRAVNDVPGAMAYLTKWQEAGGIDGDDYAQLKGFLDAKGRKDNMDAVDSLLRAKYGTNWEGMITDLVTNKEKYGVDMAGMNQMVNIYEGLMAFDDKRERENRERLAQDELAGALKQIEMGDPAFVEEALKTALTSPNLDSTQRTLINNAIAWKQGQVTEKQASAVIQGIMEGKYKSKAEVQLATFGMGKVGNDIQEFYDKMESGDAEFMKLAVDKYKGAMKDMKLKSPPAYFEEYLMRKATAENLHGPEILDAANKLITPLEAGSKKTIWRTLEKRKEVGMKAAQVPADPRTDPVLAKFDKADVHAAHAQIMADFPGRNITARDIQRVLEASQGQRKKEGENATE